ncbi:MAG: hypothetical protein Q4G60_13890 [bacterium]|nr:hypothetical protein [bacterium]
MKRALLVVDIQKDYFRGGKNELFQADEAAKRAQRERKSIRSSSLQRQIRYL